MRAELLAFGRALTRERPDSVELAPNVKALEAVAPRDAVLLRVRALCKGYGAVRVLDGVSFDVYRGTMNVIVGASGSGKTVLLRQLLRLEQPDSGSIEIDGTDIASLGETGLMEQRRKMGVVFQDSALLDSMSVFENVSLPLRERDPRTSKRELRELVRARLEALGVADAIDKLPGELSGGMKKRVAVARALITNPELMVYDEPTRGLDPITARTVDRLIESADKQFKVTSLMISHDLKSVCDIADHVSLLREGRIELTATRDEFIASNNVHVRAFLDASGIVFSSRGPQVRDAHR